MNYILDVISQNDYSPFGMLLPNRYEASNEYRWGFQGQEKDDEIKGEGNSVNYKYRMHDTRIGRFFAVDPLSYKYPHNSPYAFSENRVLDGVELEGLEYVDADSPDIESACTNEDGSGELVIGGSTYEFSGTSDYNGSQYYNIGRDLYCTPDGISESGTSDQKITDWVYTPLDDAMSHDDWVAYDYSGEYNGFSQCAYAAAKSCGNAGSDPLGGWYYNQVYMYDNEGAMNSRKKPNTESISSATDIIHISLESTDPIMVGVTYAGGANGGGDNVTDHYIVIYNRGHDSNGAYFLFSENVAGGSARSGMSADRRLYIQSDGTLRTKGSSASYNGEIYIVTGVRLSSESKKEFKSRYGSTNGVK